MRAIVHAGAGDTSVLQMREVPDPVPGPGQVRVRVSAAGLNRADILQRRGKYPAPPGWPADIPGLEYAGEVESLGAGTTRWRVGDRVMGLVGGGAQAEFVVLHQDEAMAVPGDVELADAAAIPEAFLTAWDALVVRGRFARGERVLIHAVGSGVGTAAVLLVQWLGGVSAGTSRNAEKLARARAMGLDEAIDTGSGSFRERLAAPVDVILDVLGGPALADNLECLARRGRLVLLGFLQGSQVDTSLEPVLRKRLEVIGSVMRTRSLDERVALVREFSRQVLPGFTPSSPGASAPLRPVIGARFPMTRIADAHQAMERDETFGKVVLRW